MNARMVEAFEAHEAQQMEWAVAEHDAEQRWSAEPVVVAIAHIRNDRFTPKVLQRIIQAAGDKLAATTWAKTDIGDMASACLDNLNDDLEGA